MNKEMVSVLASPDILLVQKPFMQKFLVTSIVTLMGYCVIAIATGKHTQ